MGAADAERYGTDAAKGEEAALVGAAEGRAGTEEGARARPHPCVVHLALL
eukprot:gene46787-53768_t